MKVNYDKISDAIYFFLKKGKVKKTIKMDDRLIVDIDSKGNILGIEMLNASIQSTLNIKKIQKEGIPFSVNSGSVVTI
ncbi:MAG: DUF2283 domain-containing protein [Bacteroidaceae bacterium]